MKRCYTILFFLLFGTSLIAQDWKRDLVEMNKVYNDAKSFKMDMEIKSYANLNDVKPLLDFKGKVAFKEGDYYTSLMGRITITNKRCVLVVDNPQKMLLYKKNNKSIKQGGFEIAKIDSAVVFMGKGVTVNYLVNNLKEKRIELVYKNNVFEKIEISINPKNMSLSQVVYYYNQSKSNENTVAKVVVDYTNVEINKDVSNTTFAESAFVIVKKNKVVATKMYEKYQVVNQSEAQIP